MNDSSSEKTEEPTPKKLRDARKKGQVLQVKDLASLATFTVIFIMVILLGKQLLSMTLVYIQFSIDLSSSDSTSAVGIAIETAVYFFSVVAVVVSLAYIITVIVVKVSEVGFIFSADPLKISFKKINPVEGFKRIYSKKSFVEFIKSFLKSSVLLSLVFVVYYIYSNDILNLYNCNKYCVLPFVSEMLSTYIIMIIVIFLFITVVDYWIQYVFFKKEMMMTKDEVKREYKDSEGNPEIKSERKRVHREAMNDPSTQRKGSFVVTNPTHYSIVFLYDRVEFRLPYVLNKGMNEHALNLRRDARRDGIPIVENVQLARSLYAEVNEGEFIPAHFFKPLSDVIAALLASGALTIAGIGYETPEDDKTVQSKTSEQGDTE